MRFSPDESTWCQRHTLALVYWVQQSFGQGWRKDLHKTLNISSVGNVYKRPNFGWNQALPPFSKGQNLKARTKNVQSHTSQHVDLFFSPFSKARLRLFKRGSGLQIVYLGLKKVDDFVFCAHLSGFRLVYRIRRLPVRGSETDLTWPPKKKKKKKKKQRYNLHQ